MGIDDKRIESGGGRQVAAGIHLPFVDHVDELDACDQDAGRPECLNPSIGLMMRLIVSGPSAAPLRVGPRGG